MSFEAQDRHGVKKHEPTVSLSLGALVGAAQSATPPLPGMPFLLQAFSSTWCVTFCPHWTLSVAPFSTRRPSGHPMYSIWVFVCLPQYLTQPETE